MRKARFVLSTVGISLLLSGLTPDEEKEWRPRLNRAANAQVLDVETKAQVEELIQRMSQKLHEAPAVERRRISAELNGLYGLYDGQIDLARHDVLYLVTTDTALGKAAAQILSNFLQPHAALVDIYTPPHLSTATRAVFADGIKALIGWCEECVPGYQAQGYRVIFNLTGGFKSLQGYLTIIGMFYADEMIYIFETGSHLLTIPRLPIQVDYTGLSKFSVQLEMMNAGHMPKLEAVAGIPEGMIETVAESGVDFAGLSTWGTLIWNRTRDQALSHSLLAFPRLQYSKPFRDEFEHATRGTRIELQSCLAKVSALLEDSQGDSSILKRDGGLRYKDYGGHFDNGRPIGHFYINQGDRVTCTLEGGYIMLRHFGDHSINDNP